MINNNKNRCKSLKECFITLILIVWAVVLVFWAIMVNLEFGDESSVMFHIVFFGSLGFSLVHIGYVKKLIVQSLFGKLDDLRCDVVLEYYSNLFKLLGITTSAFVVGLGLLWGLGPSGSYKELQAQTQLLIVFFLFAIVLILSTVGQELKKQVEKKCKSS